MDITCILIIAPLEQMGEFFLHFHVDVQWDWRNDQELEIIDFYEEILYHMIFMNRLQEMEVSVSLKTKVCLEFHTCGCFSSFCMGE